MACVTHVFFRKRTGCAVVQHPTSVHIYHHPGWGAGPTTTGPGKVNSRDCQGSHASGQGEDEDDGIHRGFFFLHGNTRRVVMDDFFWRTCLGSIYILFIYIFNISIYLFIHLFIFFYRYITYVYNIYIYTVCCLESVDCKLADWCWYLFLNKLLAFLCWWHQKPWG